MTPDPSTDELLDAHVRLPQHVVHRTFVAETVVLNLRTGKYHGLNSTAGEMLEGLEGGSTPREVAQTVAENYERRLADVEGDVVELCRGLLERELIEVVGADESSA
jgi:hypothetical protein